MSHISYLAHYIKETKRVQTLYDHSSHVSSLCKKYGQVIGCPTVAELCGLFHDMGKAKSEFQTYLQTQDPGLRGKINHSAAGAKYIYDIYEYLGQKSANIYELTAQLIALSICSHHTGLIDCIDPFGTDIFHSRINPDKEIFYEESKKGFETDCLEIKEIHKKCIQASKEIENLIHLLVAAKPKDPSIYLGLLARYLLSCVIDADRYDTYCFYADLPTQDADYALDTAWHTLSENLETHLAGFTETSPIDAYRSQISLACKKFAAEKGGIYRLYVPTGGGKTLSSLRYALNHAQKYGKSRIIYAIPFTTIIDQNAQVIHHALSTDALILEHHSNIIPDETDSDEELETRRLLTERWDIPIILTTTVQLLNTLFLGKSQFIRRMHNLANSIIIFDEVQTIPIKCLSLFNSAMNFLSEICGATIILCTATQPELTGISVPIRLSEPADIIPDYETLFSKCKRTKIENACIAGGYTASRLAGFTLSKHHNCKKILVILNTKTAAKNLYTELEKQTPDASLYYLSTNLCPKHRMDILEKITDQLKRENESIICVSTQLIEAGVDISFDCVIRSLAGLDSIAQAAGRGNRHARQNIGSVYIINSAEEKLTMLQDIKAGQIQTERILREFEQTPADFDNDLLSPKSVKRYYQYYFAECSKDAMNYFVPKNVSGCPTDNTLYDFLSGNQKSITAYKNKNHGGKPSTILNQAFATAGKLFHVIDQNTVSVLVPYGEGASIIESLRCSFNIYIDNAGTILRKAQQYSINLFIDKDQLEVNGIYPIANTGIFAVENICYSEKYGFVPFEDNQPIIL